MHECCQIGRQDRNRHRFEHGHRQNHGQRILQNRYEKQYNFMLCFVVITNRNNIIIIIVNRDTYAPPMSLHPYTNRSQPRRRYWPPTVTRIITRGCASLMCYFIIYRQSTHPTRLLVISANSLRNFFLLPFRGPLGLIDRPHAREFRVVCARFIM